MYRRIVERKIRAAFEGLNAGRIEAITDVLSPDAAHYFIGRHALAGSRHRPASIRRWYERLLRLLGELRFDLQRVQVEGPPWRTLVVVQWKETNTGTDGVLTSAEGTNVIRLAWGKVTSVRIYTDTTALQGTLARSQAKGVEEASAAAIDDRAGAAATVAHG
jgi:ketosteroid isomerase-like protein